MGSSAKWYLTALAPLCKTQQVTQHVLSLSKRGFSRRDARNTMFSEVTGMEKEWGMCLPDSFSSVISEKSSFTWCGDHTSRLHHLALQETRVWTLQCGISTKPGNRGRLSASGFNNHPQVGVKQAALQRQQQWVVWDTGSAFRKKGSWIELRW